MTTHHVAAAVAHLDAVDATRTALADLYKQTRDKGHSNALGARIAEAHQAIGHGLKVAGIHADLAQAQALEDIHGLLRTVAHRLDEAGRL